ncbi:MAG: membrane protein insertion efficiency factor YidD [Candidatus Omnitrophica bacterium]|nr:membrane protein insertion efficiency factor YidD [Candidatus Omnitrophota bacterium]
MKGALQVIASLPARWIIGMLKAYRRWISPYVAPACRFYPTCSVYAIEVIASFGVVKGGWLALRRILKCHPFHPGGIDLPPKPIDRKKSRW